MNMLIIAATVVATNLPTVMVEASRIDSAPARIPASVQVLDAKAIAASGAKDLPELLERRTDIFVRHPNSSPLLSQLSMRGYGEYSFGRVLVLVDGERLNSVELEAPNLMRVPLAAADRVEILHGPQTVLHGDFASAGVINITTDGNDYGSRTALEASAGSWDTYGTRFYTRHGDEESGVIGRAGFEWMKSGGCRDNGASQVWNATGSVRKNGDNGGFLSLSTFFNDSAYGMPGSLSAREYHASRRNAQYGTSQGSHARLHSYGLSAAFRYAFDDDRYLQTDAAFVKRHRTSIWRYTDSGTLFDSKTDYDLYSYSLSPRYVDKTPVCGFGNTFSAGLSFTADDYKSRGTYPSETFLRIAAGGFVRDEFELTDELALTLGVRGERFESRDHASSGITRWIDGETAGEAGLVWRPADGLKTFARASRFYHAPLCDEMTYTPGKLEPETGYAADLGLEWDLDSEWNVSLALFHTETDDEIFYNPYHSFGEMGWNGYNVNSPSKTRRDGFEGSLSWERDHVGSFAIGYTFTDARFTEGQYDGKTVPLVPRQLVRLRGEIFLTRDFAVNGSFRFTDEQRLGSDFENRHGRIPRVCIFGAGVRYSPTFAEWVRGFSVRIDVENLFDRKYCDYAGYGDWSGAYFYPAAGRSIALTLRYEF